MQEQDYVKRLLQALKAAMSQVIKARSRGDDELTWRALDGAFLDIFGIPCQTWERMTIDTIQMLVSDPEKIKILSTLLTEVGDFSYVRNEIPQAKQVYRRAADLISKANEVRKGKDKDVSKRLKRLEKKLRKAKRRR